MIVELLAVLSISAAAGFRLALPLLVIGFLSGDLWNQVPILSRLPPTLVVGVLVSWTLAEIVFSRERLVQRVFQSLELFLSPWVGAIAGLTIARTFILETWILVLFGVLGGVLALLIQFIQVGWIYRLKRPPLWLILAEDFICICLVLFAFDAPEQGGLIAMLLVWLALRTSYVWRRWYLGREPRGDLSSTRRSYRPPD
jgi:hypothetical protein